MSVDGLERQVARAFAFGLDVDAASLAGLESLLAPDEIARADRMRGRRDRARCVAGRGRLREILGRCLGRPPASIRFDHAAYGKPFLSLSMNLPCLHFSASRSDALGLVAVSPDARIGVDIERIRPLPDRAALAQQLLSADEYDEFRSIPEAARALRFFEYWTRKEALAKALGTGLRQGLDGLSLHPWPGAQMQRVEAAAAKRVQALWVLPLALPCADYVAALAAAAPCGEVRVESLPEQGLQLAREV